MINPNQPLAVDFFARKDVVLIARELLGKILWTNIAGKETSGIIVETEAYMAPEDLACHARGNRRTPRTETMFGPPGHAYVYKCYGIHNLFNVVTAQEGMAHAVLVRAIEPLKNMNLMEKRRSMNGEHVTLVNGPGKLTEALGITTDHDSIDLTKAGSPIRIFSGLSVQYPSIITGPRVGMSKLTKHCAHYPWRFRIKNNKWTSKPDQVDYDW